MENIQGNAHGLDDPVGATRGGGTEIVPMLPEVDCDVELDLTNGYVTLRVEAWDADNNRIEQEITRAWRIPPR